MPRGLTSAVKTELATGSIEPVYLVDIEFSSRIYLTNAPFDITSSVSGSSQTYLANGHLRSITGANETNRPTKNTLSFSLSGVDQTYIAVALNENIINTNVSLYKGYLDSNNAVVSDPYLLFSGRMDLMNIDDSGETCTIGVSAESRLIDLDRTRERRYTSEDQKIDFPNDKGLEFIADLQDKEIIWGR